MKKTILAAAVGLSTLAPLAQADMLLGLYAGAKGWNTATSGGFASDDATAELVFDDKVNASYFVALEHFVPIIPNIKLAQTTLNAEGKTLLNADFDFAGVNYSSGDSIYTESDITTTDFILYYELFDNDILSFDFGVNGKYVQGNLLVSDTDGSDSSDQDFSVILPMAYAKLAVGVPLTGWGAYAEGSYLSISDNTISDLEVALTYSFVDNIAVDMTLQLGYRDVSVDIEDVDDTYADLGYSGAFLGLEIHF